MDLDHYRINTAMVINHTIACNEVACTTILNYIIKIYSWNTINRPEVDFVRKSMTIDLWKRPHLRSHWCCDQYNTCVRPIFNLASIHIAVFTKVTHGIQTSWSLYNPWQVFKWPNLTVWKCRLHLSYFQGAAKYSWSPLRQYMYII